jgi:hypothetical protein
MAYRRYQLFTGEFMHLYRKLTNQRLIPFCEEKGIVYIRDFENKDVCSQFTESWRQLRRNTGELLAMTTRRTELERFRTFLRECVENEWMSKNGTELINSGLLWLCLDMSLHSSCPQLRPFFPLDNGCTFLAL